MKYERIVDPAGFPITLETIQTSLNIPTGTDDALLELYISSATDDLERDTDMALINQTWRFTLDRFPSGYNHYTIFIPKGVTISISKFEYLDSDETVVPLVDGTDYTLTQTGTEARIVPVDSWPSTFNGRNETVVFEVVLGLGADDTEMPGWVQQALIVKIKGLYDDCFEKYQQAYNSMIIKRKLFFDYLINDV